MDAESRRPAGRQEPPAQPALPRRTGRRIVPIVLVCVIVIGSAAVSLASLFGAPISPATGKSETVFPTVVGISETTDKADGALSGGQTEVTLSITPSPETSDETGTDGTLSFQQIYADTIDSVVCIQVSADGETSVGTGVILTDDGYIVTNYHVVEEMQQCQILLSDDTVYTADYVGGDEQTDLAVLKIDASGLSPAVLGDSDSLRVGDIVVAIGNPLGTMLRGTMTDGIVSAINRDIVLDGQEMTVIQTTAALNSGNSGGPLINLYGQVIGINTAKLSADYEGVIEGIGFAIPISSVKPVVEELIRQGYVSGRPSLGISGANVPEYAQIYYSVPDGVYVAAVEEGSDAYEKGVREGDIVVALNTTRVTSPTELNAEKNRYQVGDTVTLTIFRGGLYYYVDIVLGERGAAG